VSAPLPPNLRGFTVKVFVAIAVTRITSSAVLTLIVLRGQKANRPTGKTKSHRSPRNVGDCRRGPPAAFHKAPQRPGGFVLETSQLRGLKHALLRLALTDMEP